MFPFISFVAAYYLLFHGIFSSYAAVWGGPPHDAFITVSALIFVLAFASTQVVVFHAMTHARWSWLPNRFVWHGPSGVAGTARVLAWGGMAVSFSFDLFPVLNALPSLPQLKLPIWYFAIAMFAFLFFGGRLNRVEVIGLAIAVPLKFYFQLSTALLTNSIFTFVIFLCAALYQQRFKEAFGLALVCLIAITTYAYPKYFAREYALEIPAHIHGFKPDFSIDSLTASMASMARRSSHSLLTSHVMARTPDPIPYSDRSPIMDTFANHVPRIVWPAKPKEIHGNAFGLRYGVVNPDDNLTSWNLPWTVDLYITGGATSALIRIAIVTVLLFALAKWLSTFADRAFGFGVHAATVFPMFHQSSNMSLMAGNIVTVLVVLLLGYAVVSALLRRLGGAVPSHE